jgi:4-diphosphocytidyl-2-C-methyl-D-erythritol kinase
MIVEAAPAKVNLYLHVVGRRADGYHELDSLVAFTDVGDTIEVAEGAAGRGPVLTIAGPFAPALAAEDPATNLAVRAAAALAAKLGRSADLSIRLVKELPVASGIGGGSADAAATLRALARLWDLPVDDPRLFEVGATLGADVPVCVAGRACYFGGIGDQLAPAPALPEVAAVLVNPGVPVPTPAVFKARTGMFSQADRFARAPADAAELADLLAKRRNDLTGPASRVAPAILSVLEALSATRDCLLSRLSGSGATCFSLYPDAEAAAAAARRIADRQPAWWVRAARMF